MKILSIDIETFSDIDLRKCGVYRYTDSPNFDILLFAYSVDEGPVELIDLASGEELSKEIIDAILSEDIIKTAFNANFERVALMRYISRILEEDIYLDPSSWRCSEVQAALLGLPLHLEGVGKVLRLDSQKMSEGKSLIRYFCLPCKATAANGGRTRNLPEHALDKWKFFKEYNIRDVEVELGIRKKIKDYQVPESEQLLYELDQRINDLGIKADMALVDEAISCDRQFTVAATEKAYELTGLENPNSVSQLKDWLSQRGVEVESLSKKNVKELVDETDGEVKEALKLRLLMAKTSVRKYEAIERAVCSDGRVHGLFQFYGANRSGRWAGRLVQFQNLPQNHLLDLKLARDLVKEGRFDDLQMLFGNTPGVLSELIRTAFIPKEGHRFIVADFSAIEARVLSWLAGEKWRLDVFASHGKIYEASASQMFHVPMDEIKKGSPLRQKGKISELACIAEGELVLTNKGLVPIEHVTKAHKLWDGKSWVGHSGLIYKGMKEVIEYDGLKATKDHLVWIEGKQRPVQFGEAAASGAHLIQTGDGWKEIRLGDNYKPGETMEREMESLLCTDSMQQLQKNSMDPSWQSKNGEIKGMSTMFQTKANPQMARSTFDRGEAAMSASQSSSISPVRSARDRIQVQFYFRSGSLDFIQCGECKKRAGTRSNQQHGALRKRQSAICQKECKSSQSRKNTVNTMGADLLAVHTECCEKEIRSRNESRTNHQRGRRCSEIQKKKLAVNQGKTRVYDIRDAGRHHRFTVSGKLVHNCGYGGGVGALKSMGALEMGVEEHELQGLIDNWRRANRHIVKFWWDVDKMAIKAVKQRTRTRTHGIVFAYKSGMLFITLPSGRNLVYVKPKLMINKFGREGLTYEGIGTNRKWERIETYGPKIVENIVQAASRDLLAEAMLRIDSLGFSIVAHVHDEVVCEVPMGESSVDEICSIMSESTKWSEGLPLNADGYECDFYQKD